MIFIINKLPKFCPQCGEEINKNWDKYNVQDFYAGASFLCQNKCGISYQHVEDNEILKVAKDLAYYNKE